MKIIAPSILSADFSRLGEEVRTVADAGADWIHIDVMDGHFVPNITIGPMIAAAVNRVTDLPLDVHLMIENPDRYIADFAAAGADLISVHVETCPHLNRTVDLIRHCGARPGVVLNPATPVDALAWVIEYVDFVLLMSVNPGFGGQSFIRNSLEKIRKTWEMIDQRKPDTLIQVDGGVNADTIAEISGAGADAFVAGSAIFKSADYRATIADLKNKSGDAS
ncbi:MAG: ribulose-phosphate 3-epimerase [Thermodesulfobacteriota bacterium]